MHSRTSYALSGFFYGLHTYENSYGDMIHTVLKAKVKCPSCRLTSNSLKLCTGINRRGSTHLTYDTSRYIPLTCGGSLTCLLYHSVQVPNDNMPKPGKTTTHPGSHRRGWMWDTVFQKNMIGIKSTYPQFISRHKIRLQMVCFVKYKILPRRSLLSKWHTSSKYTHTSNVIYAYKKATTSRAPIFTKFTAAIHAGLLHQNLPKPDTTCGKYRHKFIYDP
jgi:hypothetical protein